jgi:hypothetical protein
MVRRSATSIDLVERGDGQRLPQQVDQLVCLSVRDEP